MTIIETFTLIILKKSVIHNHAKTHTTSFSSVSSKGSHQQLHSTKFNSSCFFNSLNSPPNNLGITKPSSHSTPQIYKYFISLLPMPRISHDFLPKTDKRAYTCDYIKDLPTKAFNITDMHIISSYNPLSSTSSSSSSSTTTFSSSLFSLSSSSSTLNSRRGRYGFVPAYFVSSLNSFHSSSSRNVVYSL